MIEKKLMDKNKLAKWQKWKNGNRQAHGLGPNPRAQLSGTSLMKSHLNTHYIKMKSYYISKVLNRKSLIEWKMDGMGWNGMKMEWNGLYWMDHNQISELEWNRIDPN